MEVLREVSVKGLVKKRKMRTRWLGQTQDGQMQGNKLRHFSWTLASILTCEGPVKVREVVLVFLSQLADDA